MRFNPSRLKEVNYPILIIALIMAMISWYVISIRDRMDIQLKVILDYTNIPRNLVITSGLINEVDVHLRGPKALLQSSAARRATHAMNLGQLREGKNVIPFSPPSWEESYRAYEILEVKPSHLVLYVEKVQERAIPIQPILDVALDTDAFTVKDIVLYPSSALVRGPEATVQDIAQVRLDLRIDPTQKAGTYEKTFPLITGIAQTTVSPSHVRVTYTVASTRTRISLNKEVVINGPQGDYTIVPKTVKFMVDLPESLKKDSKYLAQAEVRVTPPLLEVNQNATVPVRFSLPSGMTIVGDPKIHEINITRVR